MWKIIISYLPEWEVFMQGFIAFLIPYTIAKFFKWIHTSSEEER